MTCPNCDCPTCRAAREKPTPKTHSRPYLDQARAAAGLTHHRKETER